MESDSLSEKSANNALEATDDHEAKVKTRKTWNNHFESFLALLGAIIGLGNIWRFPYIVFAYGGVNIFSISLFRFHFVALVLYSVKNFLGIELLTRTGLIRYSYYVILIDIGQEELLYSRMSYDSLLIEVVIIAGAFLIPYITFVILGGFPLFFLEVAMGQYTRQSAVNMWRIAPIMMGVGIGCTMICLYCNLYYITVMAWSILYFAHSLTTGTLPWMHCDNWWNTDYCMTYENFIYNTSSNMSQETWDASVNESVLPIVEFWNEYVLRKSEGLHDLGPLDNWPMVLCLAVSWIVVYFCIFKGVQSTGKVVYFTATFPYVILLILLVRGLTLEGAAQGIQFYLQPNITKLADPNIWVQACSQVCYSYAICFTVLIAFGSFNNFKMNCYRHSILLTVSCSLTSFVAGFAIFSVLGHMAHVTGKNVSDVVASGPGLAFIAYPTALSLLPAPQLWNALFFFMIILIAVDSEFSTMEGLVAVIFDNWKILARHKQLYTALLCFAMFLFGLLFVTHAGVYIFELFNNYSVSGIAILWLALMQSIGIGWVYGSDKAFENVKEMIGYYPSGYIKFCWMYATPALLTSVLLFYIVMFSPLEIGNYVYPPWANGIGWILCMSSFLCVPGYAIYSVCKQEGSLKERIKAAARPDRMRVVEKLAVGDVLDSKPSSQRICEHQTASASTSFFTST